MYRNNSYRASTYVKERKKESLTGVIGQQVAGKVKKSEAIIKAGPPLPPPPAK